MELSFKVEVKSSKEKIWPYYLDIPKRKIWEKDLEYLTFDGEIKTGTTGKMKLENMPEMKFTLVKLVENESYCDLTSVPGIGNLYFGHDILCEDGKNYIRHTVRLEKDSLADADLEFLIGVFSDVPSTVMIIKCEVENSATDIN